MMGDNTLERAGSGTNAQYNSYHAARLLVNPYPDLTRPRSRGRKPLIPTDGDHHLRAGRPRLPSNRAAERVVT